MARNLLLLFVTIAVCDAIPRQMSEVVSKNHQRQHQHRQHRHHPRKFMALTQQKSAQDPWDDDDDGYTYGEHTNREAEDPSDYSASQFLDTDDTDPDDTDDDKGDFIARDQIQDTTN